MNAGRRALVVGALGLAVCAVGAALDGEAFLQGWLVAAVFWLCAPLGALGMMLLHELTGGAWGVSARPAFQTAAATLPLSAAAFIPLAAQLPAVFPWAAPHGEMAAIVAPKAFYLNQSAFLLRACGYLVVWLALAWLTGAWRGRERRWPALAALGLILWLASVILFALDWVMSLSPQWSAQSFPVAVALGMLITALTVIVLGMGLHGTLDEHAAHDLALMLFAATLFWIYLMYVQYLIVWTGNLPDQIAWYLGRDRALWQWLAALAFTVMGAVALGGLFWRGARESRAVLRGALWALLAAQMMAAVWVFLPNFDLHKVTLRWVTPAALVGLGGVWSALYLTLIGRRAEAHGTEVASHG